jgi:transcriptional regulator with XRE-family HTH domain
VAEETTTRPRERLGKELRTCRLLAGLSGPQLAELIGVTQSKISRTETAKYRPDIGVIRRWLDATQMSGETRERILALAEDAATEIAEYRTVFRGSLLKAQQDLIQQDAAARSIRHFQPFQIPGPMHTEFFARNALLSTRMHDEVGLEEAIRARLQRGHRLRRGDAPEYHAVLTEAALHYRPWGVTDRDQREAWKRLLTFCAAPSVTIQIIRTTAGFRQAPMCAFVYTEFRDPTLGAIVQVELPAVTMTFSGSMDLEAFERTWHAMVDVALTPDESAKLLKSLSRST